MALTSALNSYWGSNSLWTLIYEGWCCTKVEMKLRKVGISTSNFWHSKILQAISKMGWPLNLDESDSKVQSLNSICKFNVETWHFVSFGYHWFIFIQWEEISQSITHPWVNNFFENITFLGYMSNRTCLAKVYGEL